MTATLKAHQLMLTHKIEDLQYSIRQAKSKKLKVGFIPTMGALHQGHASLIEKCRNENDLVVASIFVNPTQFNNKEDLKHYPKTPEADIELLKNAGADILFQPQVEEMYPIGFEEDSFEFGDLENVMEGRFRPGHFKGVAQIVSKLFKAVLPDAAYFGEKDYQQLAIIRKLQEDFFRQIKIVPCPTMRESDGLAMSSRNMRLTKEERAMAPLLYQTQLFFKKHFQDGDANDLQLDCIKKIESSGMFKVEYFETANTDTLQPLKNKNEKARLFVAAHIGKVRLIDNIALN